MCFPSASPDSLRGGPKTAESSGLAGHAVCSGLGAPYPRTLEAPDDDQNDVGHGVAGQDAVSAQEDQ